MIQDGVRRQTAVWNFRTYSASCNDGVLLILEKGDLCSKRCRVVVAQYHEMSVGGVFFIGKHTSFCTGMFHPTIKDFFYGKIFAVLDVKKTATEIIPTGHSVGEVGSKCIENKIRIIPQVVLRDLCNTGVQLCLGNHQLRVQKKAIPFVIIGQCNVIHGEFLG